MFRNLKDENIDDKYLGNIWGWKFSVFSLVLMLLLIILMFPRIKHYLNTGDAEMDKIEIKE